MLYDNELKAGVEQQKQADPEEQAQADDEKRSQPRGGEQLAQLRAGYSISKPPQELCFAILAGQTARAFVPIGDTVERRVKGEFVHRLELDLTQSAKQSTNQSLTASQKHFEQEETE